MSSQTSRRLPILALTALSIVAVLDVPSVSSADLIITAPNVVATAGSSGSFDILIENMPNVVGTTPTYNVAADSIEIALGQMLSGVSFTGATNATDATYIYTDSGAGPSGSSLSFDNFPNTTFTASDSQFPPQGSSDPLYQAIAPGATFGLVNVTYSVDPLAIASTGAISFQDIGGGTSLSDTNGDAIPFTVRNGSFTISPAALTPEPASIVSLLIGVACVATVTLQRASKRERGS
jgi:hypothetical protein